MVVFCVLFLRRAHSPFIKNIHEKEQQRCEHRTRKKKIIALCMMQIKKLNKQAMCQ